MVCILVRVFLYTIVYLMMICVCGKAERTHLSTITQGPMEVSDIYAGYTQARAYASHVSRQKKAARLPSRSPHVRCAAGTRVCLYAYVLYLCVCARGGGGECMVKCVVISLSYGWLVTHMR